MIKIKQISKRYQTNNVLDNVSMELDEGLCTALIGKNGAGKSTLIDIIIGHIKPDKGVIEDPHSIIQPKNIGILFQKTNFPKSVKVKELYSLFKGVYSNGMSFEQFQNMTRFSDKMMNQYANDLSGGQKRLLDFILCLIGNPQLLILDEPTTAMDIETRERFWNIILKLKNEGTTILYTSHYIEEVERMADKITLLENGVVKFSGLHNEIIHNQNYSIIEFPISSEELILELQSKFKVEVNDSTIKLKTNKVQDVISELLNLKINFNEMIISKQSLLEMMFEQEGGDNDE